MSSVRAARDADDGCAAVHELREVGERRLEQASSSSSKLGVFSRFASIRSCVVDREAVHLVEVVQGPTGRRRRRLKTSPAHRAGRCLVDSSSLSRSGSSASIPVRSRGWRHPRGRRSPSTARRASPARFSGSIASRSGSAVLRIVSTSSGSIVRSSGITSSSAMRVVLGVVRVEDLDPLLAEDRLGPDLGADVGGDLVDVLGEQLELDAAAPPRVRSIASIVPTRTPRSFTSPPTRGPVRSSRIGERGDAAVWSCPVRSRPGRARRLRPPEQGRRAR